MLSKALQAANAPHEMIVAAEQGYYSDYESPLDTPCIQLVNDLRGLGLEALARRAMNGEFDATKEESDAWWEREGQQLATEMNLPPDMLTKLQNKSKKP